MSGSHMALRRRLLRRGRLVGFFLAVAVAAGVVATCDGGDELVEPDPPVPTAITITPEAVALDALGDTAALAARVLDQHGSALSGATVSWSSGDASVATVSGTGVVTAVGNGTAVVTARSGGATGQARVVVEQRVVSLVLGPDSLTFDALGDTASLVAEAFDPNGAAVSSEALAWSSGDESVVTVSGTGLVTTVGNGTAAVAASGGGFTEQAWVVVEQRVTSVVVVLDSLSFDALGDTALLVAEVLDPNGATVSGAEVSWSSGDESVATVSADGLVTTVGNGEAVVTASVEGITDQVKVAVQQRVASVVVGPDSLGFDALGDTALLIAEPLDPNGALVAGAVVSWSSADESVATVSVDGVVTAVGNGAAAVTASTFGVEGRARVVVEQRVASVVSGPDSVNFDALGDSVSLTAEARDPNGALVAGAEVSWSTGDESVATVSAVGVVTAVGNGTAAVTASADGVASETRVVVEQRAASVVAGPDSLSFDALGDSVSLAAEARDSNGALVAGAEVAWSSDDESVATVSGTGVVTAVGNGAAAVTARVHGAAGQARVVVEQRIASMVVTPDALTFDALGEAVSLVAEVQDPNGAAVVGAVVSWSSDNESVATVSADGVVTTVGDGTAVVTASVDSLADQAEVVVAQRVASVVVSPALLSFEAPGDSARLAAEPLDSNGTPVSGTEVTWASGDDSIATVSADGLVTAVGKGATVVTASTEEATGKAEIMVDRRIASVIVTPDSLMLEAAGDTISLAAEARDANGAVVAGVEVSWSSGNESAATVSAEGLVTAAGRGIAVVTARVEEAAGEARVVVGRQIASVVVTPASLEFRGLSETASLAAEALDSDGEAVTGIPVTWRSGNQSVATVNSSGLVTSAGHGTTTVTASVEGRRGSAQIEVDTLPHPDRAGLVGLYNATNGASWLNKSNWLTDAPINDWHGVGTGVAGRVTSLRLASNGLKGAIPPELGSIIALRQLDLSGNDLAGRLPDEMTSLTNLESISVDDACAPQTPAFEGWVNGLSSHNLIYCYSWPPGVDASIAYLIQAAPPPSAGYETTLVAGQPALLRVFVTAANPDSVGMPPVRATFYAGGSVVHTEEFPAQPNNPIPASVDESILSKSYNVEIPGSAVTPGLEMVVEIDPDSTLGSSVHVVGRLPQTGRTRFDVHDFPVFDLNVQPYIYTLNPDSTLLDLADELDADHELFYEMRTLMPIGELQVTVHDPMPWATNDAYKLVQVVRALQRMEGGYWMGLLNRYADSVGGLAFISGKAFVTTPNAKIIAHEVGHNLSAGHAPCGGADDADAYPHPGGAIGGWGWVPGTLDLVSPSSPDIMSFCEDSAWVSAFHFRKTFGYRRGSEGSADQASFAADQQTLLLWGGTEADGSVFLNPSLVVDAPPSVPTRGGDYRITGETEDGRILFSRVFDMEEIADGDGRSSFSFALPVASSWAGALARITLTGRGSSAVLNREGDQAAVLLRDAATGKIRGLLLDVPTDPAAQAEWLAPMGAGNLDVQVSRGVPAASAWRRRR